MQSSRLSYLIERYLDKTYSNEERAELLRHVSSGNDVSSLKELIQEAFIESRGEQQMDEGRANEILEIIFKRPKARVRQLRWWKIASAACIVSLVGVAIWFFAFRQDSTLNNNIVDARVTDFAPGREGAILTLADGRQIVLDSAANGRLADGAVKEGNVISYENANPATVEYNTMTTPKGRQYQLVLADGSKVWLNAASSITYPTVFKGAERRVSITGEAYFEVAQDKTQKFIVSSNGVESEVLGTHFNFNAYNDEEDTKVTLLEGSVNVRKATKLQRLLPGQQAKVKDDIVLAKDVDLEQVMSWKEGVFYFNNTSIETIMRQAARWYDVEIVYEGNVRNEYFGGTVPRNEKISQLIKALELTKTIDITIEGRKVIVKAIE